MIIGFFKKQLNFRLVPRIPILYIAFQMNIFTQNWQTVFLNVGMEEGYLPVEIKQCFGNIHSTLLCIIQFHTFFQVLPKIRIGRLIILTKHLA